MREGSVAVVLVLLIVLIGAGVVFYLNGSFRSAAPNATGPNTAPPKANPPPVPVPNQVGDIPANTILYTDNGFIPAVLTVKTGVKVTFLNRSSFQVWPASSNHPTHRLYPTTGGCAGSTFDACKGVNPDGSWSFIFSIPGAWKYHDHLSPARTGTVVVK